MRYQEMTHKRESCRDYDTDRPVEREKLINCLEAARLAPSAMNGQPWRFIAVVNDAVRKAVADGVQDLGMNHFASDCPVLVAVVENRSLAASVSNKVTKGDLTSIDIGLATSQFCYQALEEGLSTCILGWMNQDKLRAALNLTKDKQVRLVITLGYAKTDNLRPKKRKSFSDMALIID